MYFNLNIYTIFQSSIDTGRLPTDWRNAFVAPIFKKGDVHLAENDRPVSLTCVTCKILEHVICKHILSHLERNNILTSLNHENIVERQTVNNTKCFVSVQCKTIRHKHSFFPNTIVDWNKLEDSVVCASTVNSFRKAVLHWD
ncbi:hypothetical protein MAR_010366 [Mya arenaria]|uniref:SWIM-type domain-containing protein n=1 Tax=Mya arenaria TaxID=6604 RepID=A0ABY7E1B8_MYAAR|nr:hypothetical protein MAR_010366 [Mya arenaria]